MSESEDADVVSFGKKSTPEMQSLYRQKIEAAKSRGGVNSLKGSTPLGGIERPLMPSLAPPESAASGLSDTGGVQPRPAGSPVLSSQTRMQIDAMNLAQEQAKKAAPPVLDESSVSSGAEKVKDELWDAFDFAGQSEAERILNNRKRRQEIESRLTPMLLEDLLMSDEVQQDIIIVPGKLVVRMRSLLPGESLFVKQFLAEEKSPNEAYVLEKYSLCQLTCALVAINGKEFPDHRDSNGEVDKKAFEVKLKMVMRKSGYVIADLGINYIWFDIRVRRLLAPEALGNG